jgi:hypothetical protein
METPWFSAGVISFFLFFFFICLFFLTSFITVNGPVSFLNQKCNHFRLAVTIF